MCGIAGALNLGEREPIAEETLRRMISWIRHRGPDESGIYRDPSVGLASTRLSIVDVIGGQQPIGNEDGSLWIVFNGEIFNYVELRPGLEARGHRFSTESDTEVILHLYEELGPECWRELNGQFAIALWDSRRRSLFLARDRMGVRPLYYTTQDGQLIFGSEVKAFLGHPAVQLEMDPDSLRQVFTYWSPMSPLSAFQGIREVPPGHYLLARDGQVSVAPYWKLDFTEDPSPRSEAESLEEFESLLVDATRIRLRADVPVGAYLSGGMDSSVIASMVRIHTQTRLDTFSISFADPRFDESPHQRLMAQTLGTQHHELHCREEDIARVFPEVIWHTENPLLRTAPVPMFLLSSLVHDHGYKVVLTGEGADEVLAGYDIFKEMRVRRFWARRPESELRPLLLRRLYPDLPQLSQGGAFLQSFFRKGLEETDSPFYSHQIRWANTGRTRRFLSQGRESSQEAANGWGREIDLPAEFQSWSHLAQAQYLEIVTFLSPYLLSSQGDRVSMAHSVEGRYPFLDTRVVEFCNRLPVRYKQRGLTEKWLLRKLASRLLPPAIWQRPKRPYRAPIQQTFFPRGSEADFVGELLSPAAIQRSGYFHPAAVTKLARKARESDGLSEVDEMAIVGILSTQMVDHWYIRRQRPELGDVLGSDCKIVDATLQTA